MIASWPQAALRGGTALANTGIHGPICSVRGSAARRVRRTGPQQKAEAARLQGPAPELSTLPETWERTSLSDEGIREALRARSKHFAALDEPELADSGSMSPERSGLETLLLLLSTTFSATSAVFVVSFKAFFTL